MIQRKIRQFSPYSYNIRYKVPGGGLNQNKKYISSARGSNESSYVVSKLTPSYFCSISNIWYFDVNDDGTLNFVKCDSSIRITQEKISNKSSSSLKYITNDSITNKDSYSIDCNMNDIKENSLYTIKNNEIIIKNLYSDKITDLLILFNNEYFNKRCQINLIENNGKFQIIFPKKIQSSDNIKIIVYDLTNESNFKLIKINKTKIIDDVINNQYLIENLYGVLNYKFLFLNKNSIINDINYDFTPQYFIISKNFNMEDNGNNIYCYQSYNKKTYIIQHNVNNDFVCWNNKSIILNHKLNGVVNYIIEKNDNFNIIKKITYIDENNIKIDLNENYVPNVFTISLFKS